MQYKKQHNSTLVHECVIPGSRAVLAVLLSVLLALTPGLAFASTGAQNNGTQASAASIESQKTESQTAAATAAAADEEKANEAAEQAAKDAAKADASGGGANAAQAAGTGTQDEASETESGQQESATPAAITTASSDEITVPATYKYSNKTAPFTASVTYNPNFEKGKTTRFTYNVSDTTSTFEYRLYSLDIWFDDCWTSVFDISRSSAGTFTTNNYYETDFYTAGKYRLTFNVLDMTKYASYAFYIEFTIAEDSNFKSVDTEVTEITNQCLSECAAQGDTSDYAKALWLNDWLVNNTEYDSTYQYCSTEAMLGRGVGTCEGYHAAYCALLNKLGIETRRVDSTGDDHVWTGVKLDGQWYNVDVTWNDAGYNYSNLDLARLYFALPSSIMQLVHTQWDGQYATSNVVHADRAEFDATSYDENYFIKSGAIKTYTAAYLQDSGSYSVKSHLNNNETSFSIGVENSSWPAGYKNVIYSLVAYQLNQETWDKNAVVTASYNSSESTLDFEVAYSISDTNNLASVGTISNQTYTGSVITPDVVVTYDGATLKNGTDYTISYSNNTKVGTATATITGKGAYAGTVTRTFEITQASLDSSGFAFAINSQTYTGSKLEPNVAITYNKATLKAGTDYTVTYSNNTNAGTATATITGKGNYAGTVQKTFSIAQKSVVDSDVSIANIAAQTYTGSAIKPSLTVTFAGTTLKAGTDYTVAYTNNTNAGTATATITGKGNYKGSKSKTFTIKAASLKTAIVNGVANKTYNTKAQQQTVLSVLLNGTTLASSNFKLTYANNTNAGTATVTITGTGNYTDAVSKTFSIAQKSVADSDVSIANIAAQTYTGSAIKPGLTVTFAGTTLKAGTDYTVAYTNNTNAGTATATITGKGNYKGTKSKTFTISPKAITSSNTTCSFTETRKNATGGEITPSISNVKYNKSTTLKEGTDYYITYNGSTSKPVIAGNYIVRLVGKGNYSGTKELGTFTLLKKVNVGSSTKVRFASVSNSSYVLDAAGATPKKGANVSIWSDNGGNNQLWYLVPDGKGYYVIKSAANSKYVLDASGTSPKNGANISVWDNNSTNNQKWIIETSSDGSYYTIRNVANQDLVLDAAGATPKKGANVTAWKSSGGKNQRWKIVAESTPSFDKNKTYVISSASNSNFVLDAAGNTPKVGANISIWTKKTTNNNNQKWYLIPDGKGYYTIKSAASTSSKTLVLDAAGTSPRVGSNVSAWSSKASNNNNQKWKIQKLANGTYLIRSVANQNLVLDAAGASPKRGANVSVWSNNGGNNQKWNISQA